MVFKNERIHVILNKNTPFNILTTKQSLNKQHYKGGLIIWLSINNLVIYQ